MNPEKLKRLLDDVANGRRSPDDALEDLAALPYSDLGEARLDSHRWLRRGFPEAVLALGKTSENLAEILAEYEKREIPAIITQLPPRKTNLLRRAFPGFDYHQRARLGYLGPPPGEGEGRVVIVSGGTSDRPVVDEAFWTARYLGAKTMVRPDVGVAGLHRIIDLIPELRRANVVVAVAGMEGALPSVVAGLTGAPVIGVPTSVGLGVHDEGRTPLMAMLSSCVPGLVVVNVDGGFSAGYAAALINHLVVAGPARKKEEKPPKDRQGG
ncbi:MAG: nickel pincer cofactor biosynthesis protein LarB [Acidobacteriota bacterium]|jgi:pyridinium-3,5-biscarboxylic acid mononucleotide synthase